MHYVYSLQSSSNPKRFYIGETANISNRIKEHNSGQCTHTAKNRPWKIVICIAFRSKQKAFAFERYLKTGSGRAFAKRHF